MQQQAKQKRWRWPWITGVVVALFAGALFVLYRERTQIPGLTAEDSYPRGCVDCHINMPILRMDERFSTLLVQWYEQISPTLATKVQGIMPEGIRLSGRHPRLPQTVFQNIPANCITCHDSGQANIPPFGPMVHTIHLNGGAENHYLLIFGGECLNCHKFNTSTGKWSIPSGPESGL